MVGDCVLDAPRYSFRRAGQDFGAPVQISAPRAPGLGCAAAPSPTCKTPRLLLN